MLFLKFLLFFPLLWLSLMIYISKDDIYTVFLLLRLYLIAEAWVLKPVSQE